MAVNITALNRIQRVRVRPHIYLLLPIFPILPRTSPPGLLVTTGIGDALCWLLRVAMSGLGARTSVLEYLGQERIRQSSGTLEKAGVSGRDTETGCPASQEPQKTPVLC